jgi:CRISPR-associated exonuclease Cas4
MEYQEDDFLSLSGIQHFEFCRRQWALIHIEQQWQENVRTLEGEFLHEKAHDSDASEKRGDLIISRGVSVYSKTLGVTGACDVVEFHISKDGITIYGREGLYSPIPIEYKRGEPKENDADALQLCTQAMCLEEMLLCNINEGFLFYGETKHRLKVVFDEELRNKTKNTFEEMHQMYNRRYTPKVKTTKGCRSCSLVDICLPRLCKNISVKSYIAKNLNEVSYEKIT